MHSVSFAFDDQLRPNHCHIGYFSSAADPKLEPGFLGRIKHKASTAMLIDSLSLQILGIAAMPDFGKPKAANVNGAQAISY